MRNIDASLDVLSSREDDDVRERVDTMNEIEVRTEVLMEMFEQMDQEVEKLT